MLTALLTASLLGWHANAPVGTRRTIVRLQEAEQEPPLTAEATPEPAAPSTPARYDLKTDAKEASSKGAGFNQFDPVLSLTSFVSRRLGLAGGLGLVALLAATEGNEILKSVLDTGPQAVVNGEVVTKPSGLKYVDLLVASNGDTPRPGAVIGFNAKVFIGEGADARVLFDTTAGPDAKPVAFKYGQRPFQNVVCEGVEEGIQGMRAGAKRRIVVPASLAPKGVNLPDGVSLVYELELLEVLPGYF